MIPDSSPNPTRSAQPRGTDYRDVGGSPGIGDWIANAIVTVVTFPVLFAAKIINPFVERGGAGIQALGAVAFLGGVVFGADNYYQLALNKALLPWFTQSAWVGDLAIQSDNPITRWISGIWGGAAFVGWAAVFLSMISIAFVVATAVSLTTQFIQGQAVRGRSLNTAKAQFQHWNAPTLPDEPDKKRKLDMAAVSWKELKRTGKKQRTFMGFIALALWGLEMVSAFTAHNPLNYTGHPGQFVGCLLYAILTIVAGEVGYVIYCEAREESAR